MSSGNVHISHNTPTALLPLRRLALNLRWSWRDSTRELFESIDPRLWEELGENPKMMLHRVNNSRLQELAVDKDFLARMNAESADLDDYLAGNFWYQKTHPADTSATSTDPVAAYFSMEFGIHPSLPIYSGGLGVLAGDHMKSASDLGVPLIGVGLLYSFGYFTQSLSADGWQQERYEYHNPEDLPIERVTDADGQQIKVTVAYPDGRDIVIALWIAHVGRIPLLLLDTNIDDNPPGMQEVTDRLYGGDSEHRIKQELVLGVGGVRAVNAFCDARGLARPRVAHLNEGHAGFLGLERIRERMAEGVSFDAALAQVRAANIFTTHTPVPAGIDRFSVDLVRRYLGDGQEPSRHLCPGVPIGRALELGAEDAPGTFNMAHLGLRLSQHANGVARLHGEVSRGMFASLYPGWTGSEVPIGSVTNGVHLPTWVKPEMAEIIAKISGDADLTSTDVWEHPDAVSDDELWAARNGLRHDLVAVAREAVHSSCLIRGQQEAQLYWTRNVLDPEVLTVGFARRVSTYKRLTLMLRNPERLRRILTNPERPVQFVIAGKAHPHDEGGKQLMQQIIQFADDAGLRDRFIFLPDYDIGLAGYLVSGADIWLNNPVRPQEASGTSGMKAVMNGCLTLSVSDGWWDEMPQDGYGWTIPTVETGDLEYRDNLEAQALYDLLEHDIAPMFYDRDTDGVPRRWLEMVRRSLTTLSPMVTSFRMVRDYTEEYYRPTDASARRIMESEGDAAAFVDWMAHVRGNWDAVQLRDLRVNGVPTQADARVLAGEPMTFTVTADLGGLSRQDVAVQLITGEGGQDGTLVDPEVFDMTPSDDGYTVTLPSDRPGDIGFTARVIPAHPLLVSPAELGLITHHP
ncbi:alpha-glucan family phosphorylase [Corynebacterium sp. P7202]|uniref:glycogen phosphorylase n=1 Tax=Corynebacterium pygosceleis TaxID=2800406 RepID=A0A9Q4C6J7_9CORY|nr:alpha-glucan family phosphorylase [Corynebacterium pygosceleis]MCK7636702.1 alpha-glucan family phosphorylase [Corynebacterium pygosceleis]MCX7467455.1 alpha-glucan family phosphorylase [Corynebacterium pygosceleis]